MVHIAYTEPTSLRRSRGQVQFTKRPSNIKIPQQKIVSTKATSSLNRKSSSVRNYRGRKYAEQVDRDVHQQSLLMTLYRDANLSAYAQRQGDSSKPHSINNNVNNTISYNNEPKHFSRTKTNSRKRGAIILKGKDSRNIPSNPKMRKEFLPEPEGIKTIEYANKDNLSSIQARSITAQK